jgi:ATP-dependent DNA helicase RecQ
MSSDVKRLTANRADPILLRARRSFGFKSFRPGQEEAIESLLAGNDTLVVMPTGFGKSAIYQVSGLVLEGTVLVISPLIALQKDQVDSINQKATGTEAVVLNSMQSAAESSLAFEKIEDGVGKYVFLAPEQLSKQETMKALEKAHIRLFVVDEAHCISEWGHDFRPEYLQLGAAVEQLGHPVVLAMTATASQEVRNEIVQRLGMREPRVLVHGFDRPNLKLSVEHFAREDQKLEGLLHRVRWAPKPGIVYTATRKRAEQITGILVEEGMEALSYHGGLKSLERNQVQDQFMSSDKAVVVATNAFGMGIDKADIRFVYHHDAPDSVDAYYQEIGRAGRDGAPAQAILFFRPEDIGSQAFKTGEGKLDPAEVEEIAVAITDHGRPIEVEDVATHSKLPGSKVRKVIARLQDVGALEVLPGGMVRPAADIDPAKSAEDAAQEQDRRREMKRQRLQKMEEYAKTSVCRREILLQYFGESFRGPCGNCDNCRTNRRAI